MKTLTKVVWLTNETEPQLVEVNGVVTLYPNPMAKPGLIDGMMHAGDVEKPYTVTITLTPMEKK